VSIAGRGRGSSREFERGSKPAALDVLAREVIGAKVNREDVEGELERVPRWHFRRRAELEREVNRNRKLEQRLLGFVKEV
jgi:hypothetical protein